jgi:hypothetical protein
LVNEAAEIDGAAPELVAALDDVAAADVVAPAPEPLAALDDDEFELPQAVIASAPDTAQTATTVLLFSKYTNTPPP